MTSIDARPDIILTGVAGYIGERLAKRFCAEHHRVFGVDILRPNFTHQNFFFYAVDLLNTKDREMLVKELQSIVSARGSEGQAILFHLAGISNQAVCQRNPDRCLEINKMLVRGLLTSSLASYIHRHVLLSSAQLYLRTESEPLSEEAQLTLDSAYAESKYLAEQELKAFAGKQESKVRAIRISNTYGNSFKSGTVFEKIYSQIKSGSVVVVDDLQPVRDFIHIDDVIEGLVKLMRCPWTESFQVINLGTGVGTSVGQLISLMQDTFASSASMLDASKKRPCGSVNSIILDVAKLLQMTGWTPQIDLATGLARVRDVLMDT